MIWKICMLAQTGFSISNQRRIQDFPRGGANSPGGANIRFCQIFPKTAWNRKNWGARGGGGGERGARPLRPPKSATGNFWLTDFNVVIPIDISIFW